MIWHQREREKKPIIFLDYLCLPFLLFFPSSHPSPITLASPPPLNPLLKPGHFWGLGQHVQEMHSCPDGRDPDCFSSKENLPFYEDLLPLEATVPMAVIFKDPDVKVGGEHI